MLPVGACAGRDARGRKRAAAGRTQRLTSDEIPDQLDEFIADTGQRGADPAWLRGARCIPGRLRLSDPGALAT
ncbi:hypothetical protein [Streptomyces sp. 6N223]|uniref:hypothetical protein n=1 Tax=Streptomyces sp. 6N223 TaxID=3457412 RepID=UPI003FD3AE7D